MIRKVTPNDAKAIADIYNEYVIHTAISFETDPVTVDEMRQRISSIASRYPFIVYEQNNELIGYAYAHPWKERKAYRYTFETTVYVSAAHHHKGVGTQLMRSLIDLCKEKGVKALIACVTKDNEPSYAIHQKLGFNQVSCFEKVGVKFNKQWGVVDFELILDP